MTRCTGKRVGEGWGAWWRARERRKRSRNERACGRVRASASFYPCAPSASQAHQRALPRRASGAGEVAHAPEWAAWSWACARDRERKRRERFLSQGSARTRKFAGPRPRLRRPWRPPRAAASRERTTWRACKRESWSRARPASAALCADGEKIFLTRATVCERKKAPARLLLDPPRPPENAPRPRAPPYQARPAALHLHLTHCSLICPSLFFSSHSQVRRDRLPVGRPGHLELLPLL